MTLTTEKYFERMHEVSASKLGLLKEMLDLTKKQSEVITEETTDQLLKIIEDKQRLIESIDKLDEEFNIYLERLKFELKVKNLDELKGSTIPGLIEFKQCIGLIMKVMNEIDELDKKNNIKAKELLNNLGQEIKKLNQGKMVNQLYTPKSYQASSYYIDKKK